MNVTSTVGIPKESRERESRVAATPDSVKKFVKKGFQVLVERGAGEKACYLDSDFEKEGAKIVDSSQAFGAGIVLKVHPPTPQEVDRLSSGALILSHMEPYKNKDLFATLAQKKVNAVAMELIPRTSRAQSMDSLSSQANIAGYRAVLEATRFYPRFFPVMMTSAGSARPAKLAVLGAGVAGLQAIATARRLGAQVESYDVRPEVKEQILSLGAKFIELDIGESGTGSGGYAKELSAEAKAKQQVLLTEKLKKFDIIVSTANIPGKKSPVLITEEAVKGMRKGSVIIDMAAANGGNCPLSKPDQIIEAHGVTIVGETNYPALVPSDSSSFYGRNLYLLLELFFAKEPGQIQYNLQDDIVAAALVTHQGEVRFK